MSQKRGFYRTWVTRRTFLGRWVNLAHPKRLTVSVDQVKINWLTWSNFLKKISFS